MREAVISPREFRFAIIDGVLGRFRNVGRMNQDRPGCAGHAASPRPQRNCSRSEATAGPGIPERKCKEGEGATWALWPSKGYPIAAIFNSPEKFVDEGTARFYRRPRSRIGCCSEPNGRRPACTRPGDGYRRDLGGTGRQQLADTLTLSEASVRQAVDAPLRIPVPSFEPSPQSPPSPFVPSCTTARVKRVSCFKVEPLWISYESSCLTS